MEKTLKDKTVTALIWSFVDKFGQQLIYFSIGIYLARTLNQEDYGLRGSLIFFNAVSTILIGSGYGRALLNQKKLDENALNTIFYYNIFIGAILYTILFFCAPYISIFMKEPRLVSLSRVLFLNIIFTALLNIHDIILIKKMQLNKLAKVNIFSLIPASIITIILAYNGLGVWVLIFQTVLFTFFKLLWYIYYTKWKPKLIFKIEILRKMFPFSSRVLFMNLINQIFNNIYYLIIGRAFNMTSLGYFYQANKYQDIPTGLVNNTFHFVAMPLLSEVNDNPARLKRIQGKLIKTIAFLCFPMLFGMITIAKPMFIVLITEKWLDSVPLFQILCFSSVFMIFSNLIQESILSKGKSRSLMYVELLKKATLIALIFITIKFNTIGLAIGWAISWFISLILILYLSKKIVGYSYIQFFKDCFPYFFIAAILCGISYFICIFIKSNVITLIFSISFIGILYIASCYIFKLEAMMETVSMIKKKFPKFSK